MLTIDNTLFVGKVLLIEPLVSSTNDHAMSLLKTSTILEGTVIYAVEQYQGRGQRGNTWISEPGKNCTISIVLQPKMNDFTAQFYLNKAIALGLCLAVRHWLPKAKLKWPNDIFLADKKLAGILIENVFSGQKLKHSIVGIGVNVNQKDFGPDLSIATSISAQIGVEVPLEEFLAQLCKNIEQQYLRFQQQDYDLLQQDYLKALYRFDEDHYYETRAGKMLARIVDVNEQGQLVLQSNSGQHCFNFKEVKYY